jgi:hypothetical protein
LEKENDYPDNKRVLVKCSSPISEPLSVEDEDDSVEQLLKRPRSRSAARNPVLARRNAKGKANAVIIDVSDSEDLRPTKSVKVARKGTAIGDLIDLTASPNLSISTKLGGNIKGKRGVAGTSLGLADKNGRPLKKTVAGPKSHRRA